jgi:hypothetical protein
VLRGSCRKALAESAAVRVNEELLAGFGILHEDHPEVGQLAFERVEYSDCQRFMTLRK